MQTFRLIRPFLSGPAALGLLLLRLVAGSGMALHGWHKFSGDGGWTGWMGDSLPGWLQGLAAAVELGGGLFLVVGLLTQLVGLLIAIQMVVACAMVHFPAGDPFVGQGSSYETAALYFAISLLLVLAGPGKFSVDGALFAQSSAAAPETARQRPAA